MLAFEQAEKEVQDLHQRTREGIETAGLNGKQIDRSKGQTTRPQGRNFVFLSFYYMEKALNDI